MAAIAYHVAEAFKQGKAAHSGSFVSTGRELMSYGMRLAYWKDGKIVIVVSRDDSPSVTTSRHMNAMFAVLS